MDDHMSLNQIGLKNQELASKARAKSEGRQPRAYHGVFASHPRNDLRLQEVVAAAKKYETPGVNNSNPATFMRLMNGVTYGDSEAQGIVEGNRFYHKELNFHLAFPKGWIIQNQPNQIVATDPRSKQVLVMKMRDLNRRVSAEQFLKNNFNNFSAGRSVSTSEDQAHAGRAIVKTGNGTNNAVVGAIYRGDRAFILMGFGDQKSLPGTALLNTMQSLRKLNAKEKRTNAKEKKIKVLKVKRGDTFAKLAKESRRLGKYAEQELRLLNGMYPAGQPKVGQLIKVIR